MNYLDLVELTKDRKDYLACGVKKGMFGVVMSKTSKDRKWKVVFSDFTDCKNNITAYIYKRDLFVHNLITLIDRACKLNEEIILFNKQN